MCHRFFVAPPAEGLEEIAFRHGLTVRPAQQTSFVEVCWGECACSLYTRGEGRKRAVAFVCEAAERGLVQSLLLSSGEERAPALRHSGQVEVPKAAFLAEGLRALPEGKVARLVGGGASG